MVPRCLSTAFLLDQAGMHRSCTLHDSERGDLVAIIMGADVPFVLRSTGVGTYELVGDCYIHGVMDGEALEGKHNQVGNIVLQ